MNNTKDGKLWLILLLGFLSTSIVYVPYIAHSTQITAMMEQYHIDYTQIGIVDSVAALSAGIMVLFSGMLTYKWGARNLTTLGFLISIVGQVLFAFASSYGILVLCRIVQGLGIGLLFVGPYAMTIRWFEGTKHLSFALGAMLACDGVGFLIALYLFAHIYIVCSWSVTNIIGAVVLLALLVLCRLFLVEPDGWEEEKAAQNDRDGSLLSEMKEIYLNRNVIGTCIYISQSWGNTMTAAYWVPAALIESAGWSEASSGLVSSLFTCAGILSVVVGAITDKIPKKKPIMLFCAIAAAIAYLLLTLGYGTQNYGLFAAMLVVGGIFAFSGLLQGYTLVNDALGAYKGGAATSFVLAIGFLLGGFAYPTVIGYFRDLTGDYMTGFIALTVAIAAFGIGGALITKDVAPEERPQ